MIILTLYEISLVNVCSKSECWLSVCVQAAREQCMEADTDTTCCILTVNHEVSLSHSVCDVAPFWWVKQLDSTQLVMFLLKYLRYHSSPHTHSPLCWYCSSVFFQVCICTLCFSCSTVQHWVTLHHVFTCSHSARLPSCSGQRFCWLSQLPPCPAVGSWAWHPTWDTVQDLQEVICHFLPHTPWCLSKGRRDCPIRVFL